MSRENYIAAIVDHMNANLITKPEVNRLCEMFGSKAIVLLSADQYQCFKRAMNALITCRLAAKHVGDVG